MNLYLVRLVLDAGAWLTRGIGYASIGNYLLPDQIHRVHLTDGLSISLESAVRERPAESK